MLRVSKCRGKRLNQSIRRAYIYLQYLRHSEGQLLPLVYHIAMRGREYGTIVRPLCSPAHSMGCMTGSWKKESFGDKTKTKQGRQIGTTQQTSSVYFFNNFVFIILLFAFFVANKSKTP